MSGIALTDNTWFDESGHKIMNLPAGSSLYTKTTFDSLGRPTVQYRGYNLGTMSYADAFDVTDDVVMEQTETAYDNANNVIQTTKRQRYHNAPSSQTGELQDPTRRPRPRRGSHVPGDVAVIEIGRTVATADYGTNGGSAMSRPDVISTASDTILVNSMAFDEAGNLTATQTNPAGIVTCLGYDDRGRKIRASVPNCTGSSSTPVPPAVPVRAVHREAIVRPPMT